MVKEIDELIALITQLKSGDEELSLEDYVECKEAKYNTNDLVNLALEEGLITSHDFDLNMDLGNVHDQLPSIVWLSHAQYHAQMLSYFIVNNS